MGAVSFEREAIRQWVIDHDESWLFVGAYVALAVILSLYSLFWLLVVVALHFALELGRQAGHFEDFWEIVAEAIWEIKLDLGLVVFALALTLYLPYVFGVLGLSSAGRAAAGAKAVAKTGSRMGRVKAAIRTLFLTVDDAFLVLRGVFGGQIAQKTAQDLVEEQTEDNDGTSWRGEWSMGSWFSIGFLFISTALLLVGPLVTDQSAQGVVSVISEQLQPFP